MSLVLFSSCEKVIDVDLNEANPQIVIEAKLFEGEHEFLVKVSQTSSYFESEETLWLSDATVNLTGPENEVITLTSLGNGEYSAPVVARSNAFYTLEVSHDLGVFSASTFVHNAPQIEELTFQEAEIRLPFGQGEGNDEPMYFAAVAFNDLLDIENHYRFNLTVNGEEVNSVRGGFFLTDDVGQDGEHIDYQLRGGFLNVGDSVDVTLWSIDKATHNFYKTFADFQGTGPTSASPANPQNNWNNGALGYFAGISLDQKSIVILP